MTSTWTSQQAPLWLWLGCQVEASPRLLSCWRGCDFIVQCFFALNSWLWVAYFCIMNHQYFIISSISIIVLWFTIFQWIEGNNIIIITLFHVLIRRNKWYKMIKVLCSWRNQKIMLQSKTSSRDTRLSSSNSCSKYTFILTHQEHYITGYTCLYLVHYPCHLWKWI